MRFKALIEHLENKPGVYLMLDQQKKPIYIGKAKDLKKRLKQYFQSQPPSYRIGVMLGFVSDVNVMVTESESSALILENQLIKAHQPKYNILLKDDKSFPYLVFSKHAYPRVLIKRLKSGSKDQLFGPYTNQKEAYLVLEQLQKVFRLRNCSDHFFRNRMRPCLQYEINRCSAPCVGMVTEQMYAQDVKAAIAVLKGQSKQVLEMVLERMYRYAKEENFERAAACRDLLKGFAAVSAETVGGKVVHVFDYINLGHEVLVLKMVLLGVKVESLDFQSISTEGKCLDDAWFSGYLYHHYQLFPLPKLLVASIDDGELLREAFKGECQVQSLADQACEIYQKLANDNLQAELVVRSESVYQWPTFWQQLQDFFSRRITQILCVDVSHHGGSSTYVAIVYCNQEGMVSSQYRTYKLNANGDDYLAIRQGILQRLKRGIDADTLWIIDGGKGQLRAAWEVLSETGHVVTAVSKGVKREWGMEKFYQMKASIEVLNWPQDMVKYILHIRDEAHKTAINRHRRALRKASLQSVLDRVEGIGGQKKKAVMEYFGGLEALRCAKLIDIERVPGIGQALAKRIYQALHVE